MFGKNLKLINLQELAGLLNKYIEKTTFNSFKILVENTFSSIDEIILKFKKSISNGNLINLISLSGSGSSYTLTPGIVLVDKDGVFWIYVGSSNLDFIDNLSGYPNTNRVDDLSFKKVALNKLLLPSGIIRMNYQKSGYEFNGNLHLTSESDNGGGTNIFSSVSEKPQFGTLFAYDSTDPTKFAKYSLYKASPSIPPMFSLIQNSGLTISATNSLGTIAMSDSSSNIKIIVEIIVPNFS